MEIVGSAGIEIRAITDALTRDIQQAFAQLRTPKIGVQVEADKVRADLRRAADAADIKLDVDTAGVTGDVRDAVKRARTEVELDVDRADLRRDIKRAGDGVDIELDVDQRGLRRQIKKATDSARGAARRIAPVAGALGVGAGIREGFQFVQGSIDIARDLGEEISKTNAVFEGSADVVNRWSRETSQSIFVSRGAALEAAGTFGNLFRPLGIEADRAAEFSTRLVELGADLSSFNNISQEETFQALRSGLVGETEPLKRFGVVINQAAIEQKALASGLAATRKEITPQIKALATYELILEQTKLAQGDVQRTGADLAGQQRRLSAVWAEQRARIGAALIPVLTELVTWLGDNLPGAIDTAIEIGKALQPTLAAIAQTLRVIIPPALEVVGVIAKLVAALSSIPGVPQLIAIAAGFGAIKVAIAGLKLAGTISGFSRLASAVGAVKTGGLVARLKGIATSAGPAAGGLGRVAAAARGTTGALAGIAGRATTALKALRGFGPVAALATASIAVWAKNLRDLGAAYLNLGQVQARAIESTNRESIANTQSQAILARIDAVKRLAAAVTDTDKIEAAVAVRRAARDTIARASVQGREAATVAAANAQIAQLNKTAEALDASAERVAAADPRLAESLRRMRDSIAVQVQGVRARVRELGGTAPEAVNAGASIGQGLASGIDQGGQGVQGALGRLGDLIRGAVSRLGSVGAGAVTAGKQIAAGIQQGLREGSPETEQAIRDLGDGLKRQFSSVLEIASPSRVFAGYGEDIIQGLVGSLQKGAGRVTATVGDLGTATRDGFSPDIPAVISRTTAATPAVAGVPTGVVGGDSGVQAITEMAESVRALIRQLEDTAERPAKAIVAADDVTGAVADETRRTRRRP